MQRFDTLGQPAPEGGVVVASPPAAAGRRGRPTSDLNSTYNWSAITAWLRERPGVWARYGPVKTNHVPLITAEYPDMTVLGFKHHLVHAANPTKELMKWCDVFIAYQPEDHP